MLVRATLLQVDRRGGYSSHKVYTQLLVRLASSHYCFVLQGVSQHLRYFIFLVYQPCLIWTIAWGIRSWGSFQGSILGCLRRFWRGLRSGQGLFGVFSLIGNFCAIWWGFLSVLYYQRYPILFPGCYFPPLLFGRFLWSLACPKTFSRFIGAPRFSEGRLHACERCPEKSSTCLLVPSFSCK